MSSRVFVDTNDLVYLYDHDAPAKRERARTLLADLALSSLLTISTQVLQEFYVTVCRKLAVHLSPDDAVSATQELRQLNVIQVDLGIIFDAINLSRRYQLSFWDSLIVQAALKASCDTLLTEDLQNGLQIEGLRIQNPF